MRGLEKLESGPQTSSKGHGEHDDVRLVTRSIEDDFATVQRHVEVTDGKLATEIGQLPLTAGLEIDEPELLVRDRVWGGMHYPSTVEISDALGESIADYVNRHSMQRRRGRR